MTAPASHFGWFVYVFVLCENNKKKMKIKLNKMEVKQRLESRGKCNSPPHSTPRHFHIFHPVSSSDGSRES